MKDVAEHLGISPSTVSRALSNTGYVSQELRAKIERVAIELDYQPNLLARNLRKQFTNMIGLILPDLRSPYYTDVAQALESLLAAHGYHLLLSVSNEDPESELSYLQAMQKQRVAGIIISSVGRNDEYIGHLVQQGIPVVAHSREVQASGVDNILAPNEEGAYLATRHLIEQGHRRIGIVCGPQELNTGRDRLQGYLRALSEFGMPPDDELIKVAAFQRKFGALAAA
jgi:LacI family transcriptional regulator